jgi:hypothetical protein
MEQSQQLMQYVPVLMLALVAIAFSGGALGLSVLVGWRTRHSRAKDTPYECGMLPIGEGSTRMSVKFYLVAMLFIPFDIEVVFLPVGRGLSRHAQGSRDEKPDLCRHDFVPGSSVRWLLTRSRKGPRLEESVGREVRGLPWTIC